MSDAQYSNNMIVFVILTAGERTCWLFLLLLLLVVVVSYYWYLLSSRSQSVNQQTREILLCLHLLQHGHF